MARWQQNSLNQMAKQIILIIRVHQQRVLTSEYAVKYRIFVVHHNSAATAAVPAAAAEIYKLTKMTSKQPNTNATPNR